MLGSNLSELRLLAEVASAHLLSDIWQNAGNTIHGTTQHGVCTVLHLALSRQFRTNDCQLWYRRLPHNKYRDTLFATTLSRKGNMYAQIFATNFGWSCLFPIKLKSEAHEAVSLLFQWDGVPSAVIWDNAKEIVHGEFNRKCNEVCHLKQTEAFTPWSNEVKKEMNELKKVSSKKLIKFGAPKRLWDD